MQPEPAISRRASRGGSQPSCIRHLAVRPGGPGGRPRAGHPPARSVAIDRFERGTNLNAWLFTILRNLFHSEYRKRRREVEDPDGSYAGRLKVQPEQGSRLDFEDFRTALAKLPPDQREALLLVGASGFSYEEAAISAAAPSAPSRAASTAPARASPISSPSTTWRILVPTA